MNRNIGKNIKALAKVIGWIYLIASVIIFFVLLADENSLMGFIVLTSGVSLYFASWPLYGIGQIVDDVRVIRDANLEDKNEIASDELPEL